MEELNVNVAQAMPAMMRVEDLMEIFSIGRNTAYEMVQSGMIRSIRIGRVYRIPRAEVLAFLNGEKL